MTAALLLGVGLAFGVLITIGGLIPPQPPLALALTRLHRPRLSRVDTRNESLVVRAIGRPLAKTSVASRFSERFARDLRVTARTHEELLAKQGLCAICGLLWAPATTALMQLGGVHVSLFFPLWCSALLAATGLFVPLVGLKVGATDRRRSFRHALSCYLDLVAVRLAGGAGVESAVAGSANGGNGWAFSEIRQALAEARRMGEAPWAGLDRLGTELGIRELNELAASITLAGDEGARVRASIAAKAKAIRVHGLADAESAAQSASERMSLPIVLLMLGFVVFLGYPAVMQVLTGL
ncbi:MAG: type II secretion system F family protein [Acidimicrobiales bacterium]